MPNYLEKEWTALPPARVRGANLYSLRVCTRWRSLKPCARLGERSILREAPQGRSDKMWSESTFRKLGVLGVVTIMSLSLLIVSAVPRVLANIGGSQ